MSSSNHEHIKLPVLNLPPAKLRLRQDEDAIRVYDSCRRKWVVLTPEEWVRLNFVSYLINYLHYPASLLSNEIGITVNNTLKRCDSVVFDRNGSPMMIIEYKAPKIAISQSVFDQIVRYNMTLKARYLVVSNGLNHYCCVIDYNNNTYNFIPSIPDYNDIVFGNSHN